MTGSPGRWRSTEGFAPIADATARIPLMLWEFGESIGGAFGLIRQTRRPMPGE